MTAWYKGVVCLGTQSFVNSKGEVVPQLKINSSASYGTGPTGFNPQPLQTTSTIEPMAALEKRYVLSLNSRSVNLICSDEHSPVFSDLKNLLFYTESIQFHNEIVPTIYTTFTEFPRLGYDFKEAKKSWDRFIKKEPNSGQTVQGVPFPLFSPTYLIFLHQDCQEMGRNFLKTVSEIDRYTKRYKIIIVHKKVRQKKAQWKAERKNN